MSRVRLFTKAGRARRTSSNASLDSSSRRRSLTNSSERTRSVSEILDSSKVPRIHEHLLCYLGYAWVDEPRATKELQAGIRYVQGSNLAQRSVSVTHNDGNLTVREISGDKLVESPLHFVAQVVPDDIKGSGLCLAISFLAGHYNNQCHVFQAKTNREAADIVQAIQKGVKAYRSATKGVKTRKASDSTSSTYGRPKSSQGGEVQRSAPRVYMEDEDEYLEFKKAPLARGPSKKSLMRVSSEVINSGQNSLSGSSPRVSTVSDSTPSMYSRSSQAMPTPPKRKTGKRSVSQRLSDDTGMFTREDRVNQLGSAVEKVKENNSLLRDKCNKIQNPATPFDDALYAMHTDNLELLHNYLTHGHVSPDAKDVSGNTLLHYAVATGKYDVTKIVCESSMASLEAPGWNECHPVHRAAAEGNIPIMQLLLRKGVNVNGMDIMRRTPLHITSGKMELVECSIALLEFGAQIMATDVLGLKPCEVNPDLKEIQNRLINSACESFVASQVRDSGLVSSPSATPYSSSPTSTRPSSITSAKSHDLWHPPTPPDPDPNGELSQLLDTVSLQAKALNKAYANKSKFRRSMNHMHTRSHSNLSELQEAEEDEMHRKDRLEQLKFPSELQLYSPAYEVEENAHSVMSAVNKLTDRASRMKNPKRGVWTDSGRGVSLEMDEDEFEASLSEPNLARMGGARRTSRTDEIPQDVRRPFSSTAVLQGNSHHRDHPTSSTGTLVSHSEAVDSSSMERLQQAFEELQEEVTHDKSNVSDQSTLRLQLQKPVNLEADSSPLLVKRSKEETVAILNDIINDIQTFSDDLESPLSSPLTPHTPLTPVTPLVGGPTEVKGQMTDGPTEVKGQMMDGESENNKPKEPPKTLDSPTSGTLKKNKGKFPMVKRISSPLIKVRRKSTSTKSADKKEEKLKLKQNMLKRKVSLPEINTSANNETEPKSPSMEAIYSQFTAHPPQTSDEVSDHLTCCEPVNTALKLMVTLSSNKECTATLISYICLPKCEAKLLKLAQDLSTPLDMLTDIAALVQNVFEAGGGEGRRNALSSGVLDLTIKLLNGRDPIPGTCLSLLNSLLVSEDDTDYLRTIIRIPSEPLLLYLEPCEPYEVDNDRRDTAVSMGTRSSSDSGFGRGKMRGTSFGSEISETSSGRSVASPTLQGHIVTNLEAKRIVLKMLAVASSHHKMQNQLSSERAIGLLADCLKDPSLENVTNAVITLANVAQHTGSHKLLLNMGLVDNFCTLLSNGPRPRYHAARALVYLGKLDMLTDFSLFEPTATGYETDVIVTTTDENGHVYARAATIEKCVEFITGDVHQLWGGFHLSIGPQSPTGDVSFSPKATKEQIINFFLTTYQSFVRPIILMRLLLHRLASPKHPQNPFNWCLPSEISTLPSSPKHTGFAIPPTQMSVLTLIGRWLESFPDDFIEHSELQTDVTRVIKRLRLTRGPFIPHTHRLRSLMQDLARPRNDRHSGVEEEEQTRVPHHENLYQLCKQMVTGGHLPVSMDEAVFIAALQLHIDDVNDPFSHIAPPSLSSTPPKSKKGFTLRLKSALPFGYAKTKTLLKRVKVQMENFENLSERNSKHLYIERCQGNPGYDCTFFSVKVPSGGRFKRGGIQKQLLGISTKRVIFLDEKTKELLSNYTLQSVLSVSRESDPCQLVLHLRGDPTGCKVQVESPSVAREISNVLEQCREGEGMVDESLRDRWSDSIPSLFTISAGPGELDESISTPTSNENSLERDATPPGFFTSHDLIKNGHSPFESPLVFPNGGVQGTMQTHKSDTLKAFSRDDLLVTDLTDNHVSADDQAPFCDCPPDPELPSEINLKHLSLTEVLGCPLEVARQMTLIAHERFCTLTPAELLQKVNLIPKPPSQHGTLTKPTRGSLSLSDIEDQHTTSIKKLAFRFNQVGNWVANSILQYEYLEERVEVIQQFIKIATHCLEMRNTSSMMAIIVAGLGSAPIRRLHATWELVPKPDLELFKHMDSILEERNNYKCYREKLSMTAIPAVPYVGVFLKDLTFICDGNPDYLRGGLINLHKRRQVYKTLEEIHYFQQDHFKFHRVPELQQYLLSHHLVPEDDLHSLSHKVEPRMTRSSSHHGTRSLSASQKSFFKLSRSGSASASNLNKT